MFVGEIVCVCVCVADAYVKTRGLSVTSVQ